MRGFTGSDGLFHADASCHQLTGSITGLPEMMALKWGLSYCPECTEPGREHAESER